MEKILTLKCGPGHPGIETFEEIVLKRHVPYGPTNITIQINFNLHDHQESPKDIGSSPGVEVKQYTMTQKTSETLEFELNFSDKKSQSFLFSGRNYFMELLRIDNAEENNLPVTIYQFKIRVE